MIKNILRLFLLSLLCLTVTGCITSSYVKHKQYLLDIKALPEKINKQSKYTVILEPLTAIAPFDQLDFLYRVSADEYKIDYYNGFLVTPTEQLEPIVINYLKALGDFNLDFTRNSVEPRLKLQITEFYADYRDRDNPSAVIALHFILTKLTGKKTEVLFDKILRAKVALKAKTNKSLLIAWKKCLQDVLTRGVYALNKALSA